MLQVHRVCRLAHLDFQLQVFQAGFYFLITDLYVNEAYIGKNSGVTTFKKKKDYVITARKEGCTDASYPASKSFDATTLLGVLIDFGIISVLVIDGAATGAWQQFDQTSYVLDPVCSS
jgi:hypothetical protein